MLTELIFQSETLSVYRIAALLLLAIEHTLQSVLFAQALTLRKNLVTAYIYHPSHYPDLLTRSATGLAQPARWIGTCTKGAQRCGCARPGNNVCIVSVSNSFSWNDEG